GLPGGNFSISNHPHSDRHRRSRLCTRTNTTVNTNTETAQPAYKTMRITSRPGYNEFDIADAAT
ncbi:hypothetical protein RCF19_34575, partial [Rhodococcus qingshengii]